jgi:hypothetical protein
VAVVVVLLPPLLLPSCRCIAQPAAPFIDPCCNVSDASASEAFDADCGTLKNFQITSQKMMMGPCY